MPTCGIYKIENLINHKIYIGKSINIEARWRAHKSAGNNINHENKNYPLYKSMYKYGVKNFDFCIIEECLQKDLDEKEKYYIKFYNSLLPNGYNIIFGNYINGDRETLQKVINIRKDLKESNLTEEEIGYKYNTCTNMIIGINTGYYWHDNNIDYPIRKLKVKEKRYCKRCGKIISDNNLNSLCKDCNTDLYHDENWPSREKLKQLIRVESFVQIGKDYKVSDNAIRKWCDFYNLPRRKKDIKKYSDEEWEKI